MIWTCNTTRPSILCVTHQMSRKEIIQLAELCLSRWWIKSGTWWYWISIWRYWLVLGQYKLELLGFRWYRVSKGLVCLYILEKVEIWSGVTNASHTDWQTSEYRATQLVSSIKFKLSHAIWIKTKQGRSVWKSTRWWGGWSWCWTQSPYLLCLVQSQTWNLSTKKKYTVRFSG